MQTEEQLVYLIQGIAKKNKINDDSKIDERIIRGFLRSYRGAVISKYSFEGMTISDECFQYMGELRFDYLKPKHFVREMPKLIRLQSNFGMMFEKNGENVPIMDSEAFTLGLKNIINGRLPKAKFLSNRATVFIGKKMTTTCAVIPAENSIINDFEQDVLDSAGQFITLDVHAVLENPDDCPDYDWTRDPYPLPSELTDFIKTAILQKEYNILFQTKTDKVGDGNDSESIQDQRA